MACALSAFDELHGALDELGRAEQSFLANHPQSSGFASVLAAEREPRVRELDAAEGPLDGFDRGLILDTAASLRHLAQVVLTIQLEPGCDRDLEEEATLMRHPRRHIRNAVEVFRRHP